MTKELYFVTSNKNKAKEVEAILGLPIEVVEKELKEIQSLDIEEIVRQKAADAYEKIQKPLFVEDVGMYVENWNGFPGPLYRYINDCGGPSLFLRMLKNEKNRNLLSKNAVGFHDGNKIHTFIGEIKGKAADESKGLTGFGWDPVFIPQGYDKTFAELGPKLKNTISARSVALTKFKKFLQANN